MRLARPGQGRRLLAPEVVQTSAMDCGPAALKCLLEGFHIPASYARLQEACQTDLDGTSINTIEQIAVALGLDAEQVMMPVDHLLLGSAHALPALVVVRRENMTHFLIAWRRHGPFVQVMDPARGRRWLRPDAFGQELYLHAQRVPASAWREWAGSDEFVGCVTERLAALGLSVAMTTGLLELVRADPGWRRLAMLDAATRMVADLVRGGGLRRRDAGPLIQAAVERAADESDAFELIPANYRSVLPDRNATEGATLILRGAVLLRVRDRLAGPSADAQAPDVPDASLPQSLSRALSTPRQRPLSHVWRLIRREGILTPSLMAAALALVTVGTFFEILLLRGFLEVHNLLALREHRLVAVALLFGFAIGLLLLELAASGEVLRLGRQVETRLRAALLAKLPTLGDRYFHSRLVSDMAHRAHSLDALRGLPDLGAILARTAMQLLFTAVALAWLDPATAWIAAVTAAIALVIPLGSASLLAERELRQRNHSAALSRHYLDSLLGLVAVRTHGAERALRQQHERLLMEWGRSSVHLLRGGAVVEGLQTLVGSVLAAWLVLDFAARGQQPGSTLLLVYWALSLPVLGRELTAIVRQFPAYRNILMRVLEPLDAPEEPSSDRTAAPIGRGVEVRMKGVDVEVGGQTVLANVGLTLRSGEHVAIVGRSGAGKSSLVGLLLGWRAPSRGSVNVDGHALDGARLVELRRATAWVDPSVQLWNQSLFDNLRYGDPTTMISNIGGLLEATDLVETLEKLPQGLQSPLGEGGRLTSGGEGQRIRFGRALLRPHVRLAVLDEPFRGLDRQQRHDLLARARTIWRDATLLFVTHDIDETRSFDRVLVVDGGRVVEDGKPNVLGAEPNSVYAALLKAEETVRTDLWSGPRWRHWRLQNGTIGETCPRADGVWVKQPSSGGL